MKGEGFMGWLILLFGIGMYVLIHALAKSDTRIGTALRDSDHRSWEYAVEDRERELAELRAAEPRR